MVFGFFVDKLTAYN